MRKYSLIELVKWNKWFKQLEWIELVRLLKLVKLVRVEWVKRVYSDLKVDFLTGQGSVDFDCRIDHLGNQVYSHIDTLQPFLNIPTNGRREFSELGLLLAGAPPIRNSLPFPLF